MNSIGYDTAAQVERAASQTGVRPGDVERLSLDLSALEANGLFLNVDARGFGLFDRRLDWQALGVTLPAGSDVAFRPPRCGLLPDRYRLPLLRPAARAHTALARYSYRFSALETVLERPPYRWVPWTAFPAFEGEFQATCADLEQARRRVLADYEAIRAEMAAVFERLAGDAERRLRATGQVVLPGFRQGLVSRALAALPAPHDLQDKLCLRYRVGVLELGSDLLGELAASREQRLRLERTQAAAELVESRRQTRERCLQLRLQAVEDELRREAEVKEQLRQLKLQAARERLEEAVSPLVEGAQQLHAAVYDSAVALRDALQRHGHLPPASVKRARELVRWFRLMAWREEPDLEALLAELEALAAHPKGSPPPAGALEGVLGDLVEHCYADARALRSPNRMAALEL